MHANTKNINLLVVEKKKKLPPWFQCTRAKWQQESKLLHMGLPQCQAQEWSGGPSKKAGYPDLQKIRPEKPKR